MRIEWTAFDVTNHIGAVVADRKGYRFMICATKTPNNSTAYLLVDLANGFVDTPEPKKELEMADYLTYRQLFPVEFPNPAKIEVKREH